MIKLSMDELNYMRFFEKKTKANIKDCIINQDGTDITIIAKEGDIGLVIGKKGAMIHRLKEELGKEIHVYEHSEDMGKFIKNLLYPIKVEKVDVEGDKVTIHINQNERKRAIGRNGKKINTVREITKRYHNIDEIKVV